MTTITIERELMERALEVIVANTLGKEEIENALRTALSAPATTPECKTSGGDARAVALARLLDQAYERGVAVGLSQAVPATAPDWHDVQPPFGSIRNAAMAIYRPPFRFVNGYVYDSQNHVVADHDNISEKLVTGSVCARVRGWGRIGYMPNAAKLQDEVGALIADALNEYYAAHPQMPRWSGPIPEDKP